MSEMSPQIVATDHGVYIDMRRVLTADERAQIERARVEPRAVGPTWIHPAEIFAALGNRSRGLLTNPLDGGQRDNR